MSDEILSLSIENAAPKPEIVPQPLVPAEGDDRVAVIDVLRGLALFGILAANIRAFAGPPIVYGAPWLYWPGLPDRIAQVFIDTFVQGKFITIFAFLFGVGFAAQLSRAEARGARFGGVYARRLAWLVVFGLIHGLLIWFGDILLVYALAGFILLLFRKRCDLTLLRWGVIGYLVPVIVIAVVVVVLTLVGKSPPKRNDVTPQKLQQVTATYRDGSWSEIQSQRMKDVVKLNWGMMPLILPNVLGLFLFGVLAWRRKAFDPAPESLARYRLVMWWALSIGTVGNAAVTAIQWMRPEPVFRPTPGSLPLIVVHFIATPALSLGYACAVVLLFRGAWRQRLAPFAAIGRTALSNYLLQSIIGTLVFYSYGLGLLGTVGPALLLIPTFLIYGLQAVISVWWLRHFRFGPAEWLWRSLTYAKMQPFVKKAALAAPAAAA